jgi:3-oxoacyl-[acyl-carrier protein] reductase
MPLMGMIKALSRELGPESILINIVGPGKIATERINHLDSLKAEKESISLKRISEKNAKTITLGCYGLTEDVAKMVVFLRSEANTYITGKIY